MNNKKKSILTILITIIFIALFNPLFKLLSTLLILEPYNIVRINNYCINFIEAMHNLYAFFGVLFKYLTFGFFRPKEVDGEIDTANFMKELDEITENDLFVCFLLNYLFLYLFIFFLIGANTIIKNKKK